MAILWFVHSEEKNKSGKTVYKIQYKVRDRHGRERRSSKRVRTKTEIAAFYKQLEKEDLTLEQARAMTLEELLGHFIESKKRTCQGTTIDGYQINIDNHINPRIGNLRLGELRTADFDRFFDDLRRNGRTDGKGGLRGALKQIFVILHGALKLGVKQGWLEHNVLESYRENNTKVFKTEPFKSVVYESEDVKRFMKVAESDRMGNIFLFVILTGVRRGEICGLRWPDVDFDRNVINFSHTLVHVRGGGVVLKEGTKNNKSFQVAMNDRLKDLMTRLYEERNRNLPPGASAFVFVRKHNPGAGVDPIKPGSLSRLFPDFLKRHGLKHIWLHACRHTFATTMLTNGVSIYEVAKLLNHGSVEITYRIYGHLLPDQTTSKVNSALKGAYNW